MCGPVMRNVGVHTATIRMLSALLNACAIDTLDLENVFVSGIALLRTMAYKNSDNQEAVWRDLRPYLGPLLSYEPDQRTCWV